MTPRDALATVFTLLWLAFAAVMLATVVQIEAHRPGAVRPDTPVLDTLYGVAVPRLTASLRRGCRELETLGDVLEAVRPPVVRWDLAQAVD